MVTEQEYNKIAEEVYSVDSGKVDNPVKVGNIVADGKYQVLKTEDNRANGMQEHPEQFINYRHKYDNSDSITEIMLL